MTAARPADAVSALHSHARARVGLIVPPANPTAEPEIGHLLGSVSTLHTTRFAVRHEPLRDRLASYNRDLPDKIGSFGGLPLDALVMACSGSRYLLGPQQDEESCTELSARWGVPVATATFATREVLRRLDTRDFVLVSPYEPWLTEQALHFWEHAGWQVRVVAVRTADGAHAPYEIGGDELVEQVEQAGLPHDAVVLCTGTGMTTLPVLPYLAADTERVVLTSNLCAAWWTLGQIGAWPDANVPWSLARLAEQGFLP
ncbi:hypothetical protein AB0J43_33960 [Nonomuraea fuscirosea]